MRRAAMAFLIVGFMVGEMVQGLGWQPAAEAAALAATANSVKAKPAKKNVTFGGYSVSVPANWPVYDLTKNPRQCVRYDIHAVYLGSPRPDQDQDCPPDLVGRVDTISIGSVPKAPKVPKAPRTPELPQAIGVPQASPVERGTAGDRKTPARTGQQAGVIVQDPNLHQLVLTMPDSAPPIGATYGTDPGSTRQILTTVRPDRISRKPVIVERPVMGGQPAAKAPAQVKSKPRNPAWPVVTTPPTGVPPGWLPPSDKPAPPASPTPTPTPKPTGPVLAGNPVPAPPTTPGSVVPGFDTCAAPSLPTMKAWRARYAATAIYIGGQMMGCGQSNLSASWIQQAKAMGWALMPTFVGLQAPCDTFSGKINPRQAAAQGTAAASQAVAAAASYGLGKGSPIYYDMEGYDRTNAGCHTAVMTFLDAWTRQLEAVNYVPGVYSSADAAIKDLQTTTTIAGHPLAEPKAIWIALWDNAADLDGTPYVTSAVWPNASRAKQYQGNKTVTVGGISLQIDADMVAGPVVRK
jgi:glycoside hydrolase-like protein